MSDLEKPFDQEIQDIVDEALSKVRVALQRKMQAIVADLVAPLSSSGFDAVKRRFKSQENTPKVRSVKRESETLDAQALKALGVITSYYAQHREGIWMQDLRKRLGDLTAIQLNLPIKRLRQGQTTWC